MKEEQYNPADVIDIKETKEMTPEKIEKIRERVESAEGVANVLDSKYLDSLLGLIPGVGDAASAMAGLYIIYEARKSGVGAWELSKMLGRTGFDFLAGTTPAIGDFFDSLYKSNEKNAKALRKHFEQIESGIDTAVQDEKLLVESDREEELRVLKSDVELEKAA